MTKHTPNHDDAFEAALAAEFGSDSPRPSKAPGSLTASEPQSRSNKMTVTAGLEHILASDVVMEPTRWMWANRLVAGMVNSISGEGGLSKTTLFLTLAACVTRGSEWPDGCGRAEQGHVIFMSAEDDIDKTLVPRFIAAGGDPNFMIFVTPTVTKEKKKRMFNIADDIPRLEVLLKKYPTTRMVGLDPIGAYMGSSRFIDTFKDSDVRTALGPLKELAEKFDVCTVFIGHFKKGTAGKVKDRMMGSVAFTALARCNWVVIEETDNDDLPTGRLLFARSKQNIGEPANAMAYRLEGHVVDEARGIKAVKIIWDGAVDGSADLLTAMPTSRKKGESPKLLAARIFLTDMLDRGPVPTRIIRDRARAAGHAEKTIDRAKDEMRVVSLKTESGWVWTMPEVETEADG